MKCKIILKRGDFCELVYKILSFRIVGDSIGKSICFRGHAVSSIGGHVGFMADSEKILVEGCQIFGLEPINMIEKNKTRP